MESKNQPESGIESSLTKSLKVQFAFRGRKGRKRIPLIRFGGQYLRLWGFEIGSTLVLTIVQDQIVIKKQEASQP